MSIVPKVAILFSSPSGFPMKTRDSPAAMDLPLRLMTPLKK